MIKFIGVRGVDVEVVDADGLSIFCQFNIVKVTRFLINIMNDDEVVDHLNLVELGA